MRVNRKERGRSKGEGEEDSNSDLVPLERDKEAQNSDEEQRRAAF